MELAGKIIAVSETREGVGKNTGNTWKAQTFVIETHEQYPRKMAFDVFGEDRLRQFNIQMGEELNVKAGEIIEAVNLASWEDLGDT